MLPVVFRSILVQCKRISIVNEYTTGRRRGIFFYLDLNWNMLEDWCILLILGKNKQFYLFVEITNRVSLPTWDIGSCALSIFWPEASILSPDHNELQMELMLVNMRIDIYLLISIILLLNVLAWNVFCDLLNSVCGIILLHRKINWRTPAIQKHML